MGNRKNVLGITGGVGAGKSTILDYLEQRYHACVIQLDQAAHLLMEPGTDCYDRICEAFGRETLDEEGKILRPVLAEKVFHDRAALERLNGIVHPAVKAYVREQIRKILSTEPVRRSGSVSAGKTEDPVDPETSLIVLEAALLLEEHYDEICDEIWYVYVPEEIRRERLARSRDYSREKTDSVLRNQKSDAEFRSACQFVIDNSSEILENTYGQIDKGLREHGFL